MQGFPSFAAKFDESEGWVFHDIPLSYPMNNVNNNDNGNVNNNGNNNNDHDQ